MAISSTPFLFLLLLFFFFFLMQEATADKNQSTIELGSWLSPKGPNTSWPSNSGRFAFGFYPHGGNNGFAVGIWLITPSPSDDNSTTVVWTANRDNPPLSSNSILNLTKHGLLLQNGGEIGDQNLTIFDSYRYNSYSRSYPYRTRSYSYSRSVLVVSLGSMNDNGNFVLYNDTGNFVVWQSFDYPTDTILGGQNLTYRTELVSSMSISDHSSGRFFFGMQSDGNLVGYPMYSDGSPRDAYWSIGVPPPPPPPPRPQDAYYRDIGGRTGASTHLNLNVQGSLCLKSDDYYNTITKILWSNAARKKSNNTTTLIYRAIVEPNGNFILYQHQFEGNTSTGTHVKTILWQALNDTCQIKGYCGSNSYCSNFNKSILNAADCQCFPGFNKNATTVTADCVQIHSNDNCESSEDPTVLYNITHFQNMTWGDIPYIVIPMKDQEACEKACRQDCDCGGAFYDQTGGNCRKYKLPIIYARFQNNQSSIALIKTPSPLPITIPPTSNNTDLSKPIILSDNKTNLIIILSFTLGSISFILLVFAVCVFITYRRQLRRYTTLSQSDQNMGFTQEYSLRAFSFDELVKSTKDFAEEIGRGSFGAVYGGTIVIGESNKRIAVKRLERINNANDHEGEREFRAEVTAIARTHHRNLVKLIGFCIDGSRKLLVYEYLSNGSLASLLFEGGVRLCSKERMKIALDVARGLLYLHEECEVRIIHCNIKPRNILMDEAWNAKITDFGLARLLKREYSRMKIGEDSKSGYLAPEWQWQKDSPVSVKADIYSFGIVLLEIVCRRSSIDMNVSSAGEILLSNWAYQCFAAGQLNKLVTPSDHEEDVDWKVVERMVKVGLWCVQDHPSLRPSIKNVILMLEGLKDIPVPPSPARMVEI